MSFPTSTPSPSFTKPTPSTSISTVTPKRKSGAFVASQGALTFDQPSPSKKRKFMTDALDEAIERGKKGEKLYALVFLVVKRGPTKK